MPPRPRPPRKARTRPAKTRRPQRPAARRRSATPARTARILDILESAHPEATCALHYRDAFQLLVATILSAQSTDRRVNEVTPALFRRYPNARALAAAEPDELEPQIHEIGRAHV